MLQNKKSNTSGIDRRTFTPQSQRLQSTQFPSEISSRIVCGCRILLNTVEAAKKKLDVLCKVQILQRVKVSRCTL